MKEFSIPPPIQYPNPLREMQELQKEIVGLLSDLAAEQSATRVLLHALVATHPQPQALLACYLEGMDQVAETVQTDHRGKFFEAIQRWRDTLLVRTAPQPDA